MNSDTVKKIAVVGAGVIGLSTALAIKQEFPNINITIISDRPFEKTCSYGPAGIFRVDDIRNKEWAKMTFLHFAKLHRSLSPTETGIKMVSGFIQSDDESLLKLQTDIMSDIVFNFHWLTPEELKILFHSPSRFAIHFTTFSSEGRRYVPWLQTQLIRLQIAFQTQNLKSLVELYPDFDIVINCSGLNGGKLAGDDDTVYPVRGVAFEVAANWQKHFNYRNLDTFTIPLNEGVMLGTVKQSNRNDTEVNEEDRKDIWERYLKLHPDFKGEILSEWCGLRPARPTVRLEHCIVTHEKSGRQIRVS